MDAVTIKEFKALEHRSIAHVDAVGDAVELGIPESEGWRFVISATLKDAPRTMGARSATAAPHRHPADDRPAPTAVPGSARLPHA
jgi:hypothetical protein